MRYDAQVQFHPLTPGRWGHLEALFGPRGGCGGCWCMWWRLPHRDFVAGKGALNKRLFRRLVQTGPPPGILAYDGDRAVGWCALAPREAYPRFAASRTLQPIDGQPVWSVTCLFVLRSYRRRGVSIALLKAAARYAASRGARLVEGYPTEGRPGLPDVFYYAGLPSAFGKAGYREVARPTPWRAIFRRRVRLAARDERRA
jgi:GNAT superfamily N-acetyltransferase